MRVENKDSVGVPVRDIPVGAAFRNRVGSYLMVVARPYNYKVDTSYVEPIYTVNLETGGFVVFDGHEAVTPVNAVVTIKPYS